VESKSEFLTHAKHSYKTDITIYNKPPAFKAHLLEQESIRNLYRNRLNHKQWHTTQTSKYKMTISSTKTKSMAMWGNHIQRVKIVINDNIIEQGNRF